MALDSEAIQLVLQIDAGQQADQNYLDRLTRQLLTELRELEVESAEMGSGTAAPDGTKSAEAAILGELAVKVLPVALGPLVGFLQSWLHRGRSRSGKIKIQNGERSIELDYHPGAMSIEELKELADSLMVSAEGK